MPPGQNPSPGFRTHPEHTITVAPYGKHVTVRSNGSVIASSDNALVLQEHKYAPIFYIPFADIDFSKLAATDSSTHKDAMWAYQHPYDEMLEIKDHGAFYPSRVTVEAT